MTTHYVDLTVVPDAEIGIPVLMGALYDRLHRSLVELRLNRLGVSFPKYSLSPRQLGDTLRLHSDEEVLRNFLQRNWLGGMRDYVRISGISTAPAGVGYRNLFRRQFHSNVERLRRRRMRRKGESAAQAAMAIPNEAVEKPTLPYAQLRSLSTGHAFSLFIAMSELKSEPVLGTFNSYGLGEKGSTVPWF